MFNFYDRFIHKYPYTDLHELNLDWIINAIKELAREVNEWEIVNKISYGGDWDITKQYTAWTIVCVNGTEGYIAIQPVPAGIDYTNTDYWRLVADFTVQLAGIAQRVTDLENEDIVINGRIDTLANTVDTKINDLNKITSIRNYNGRRIICISDSYGLMPSTSDNWIVKFQNITGLNSSDFFSNCHNGSGFIGLSGRPTFLELLQGITITDPDTITDVIIAGGYNDAAALQLGSTDLDMRTAIASFISYVNTNIPNAKISILPCCWCIHDYTVHKYIRQFINVLSQVPIYGKNVVYSDSALYCLHYTAFLDSTGFHPTSIGADLIAESIAAYLLGGTGYKCVPGATANPTVTAVSPINTIGFQNLRMTMDGPIVNINSDLITMSGSITCNSGYYLKVADLGNTVMVGGNDTNEAYKIPCIAVDNTNNYFSMYLVIMRGEIHIQPLGYSLNNATNLAIFGINYSGITML